MNINIPEVITPPSIYHGFSTQKTFLEEKFTLSEFTPVNIKIVVVAVIGNKKISRIVISTSPWTSH